MNKYHEALNAAMKALELEIKHIPTDMYWARRVEHRKKCMIRLAELQNSLDKIAQLKQSLKELDLEESK